jgi:hypothetical protein
VGDAVTSARCSGADDVVGWLESSGACSRAPLDREPPEEQTP